MSDVLYIVIPAYNEEENIGKVLDQWLPVLDFAGPESRLIVINDGSKDRTGKIIDQYAEQHSRVISITKPNSGHGPTCYFGYAYALKHGADWIFQTDSDGQTVPEDFKKFWKLRKQHDIIVGHRKKRQDGLSRIMVTKVLQFSLLFIFGAWITDANTPFRLMKGSLLSRYMKRIKETYSLPNVLICAQAVLNKDRIIWLPITFLSRQGGENSINIRSICQSGLNFIKELIAYRKEKG